MKLNIKRHVAFLLCWWFGHDPEYTGGSNTYCNRCGLWDIEYNELVTGSRSYKVKQFFIYWLYRRWWPEKCKQCGKRYGCGDDDCVPF